MLMNISFDDALHTSYRHVLSMPSCCHTVYQRFDFVVFAAVSLGLEHTLALTHDGAVWAAGLNTHGQVGISMQRRMVLTNLPRFFLMA